MKFEKRYSLLLVLLIVGAAACTSTAPPPPEPVSETARRLIDPSIGFETTDAAAMQSSAAAWSSFQAGRVADAERQWQQILIDRPDFSPARVGLASVAIARNQFERAEDLIAGVTAPYPASIVVRAELLVERGNIVEAAEMLRPLTALPTTPSQVIARYDQLKERAVRELVLQADQATSDEMRIETLKRAVDLSPRDSELRLRLVEDLITLGQFAEARTTLTPMMEYDAALNRVQAALAEIEIAEGKYQAAMRRYERLVDRTGDYVYQERLERSKRLWHESTLPQQFQLAVRSPNITREQLAVLLFWKLPSIRFAQNLPQPPIVVDIGEVMGREELIRVLSMGLLPLDRATRTIRPGKTVTVSEFLSTAASAMRRISSDPCVTPVEGTGPVQRLQSCGIDTMGLQRDPDGFVTGVMASAVLDQIAGLDPSAE